MMSGLRRALAFAVLATLTVAAAAHGGSPAPAIAPNAPLPELNAEQQAAAGIRFVHPVALTMPTLLHALGEVLDPQRFVADSDALAVAESEASAAAAEVQRLQQLFHAGASASLKALQQARSRRARAEGELAAARSRLTLRWGILAQSPNERRRQLAAALVAGERLLLRATLLGRHSVGTLPRRALVDIDGVRMPARVLGTLQHGSPEVQGASLLLEIDRPPAGLGVGARLPVILQGRPLRGIVVPAEALLYGEDGAYVYRRMAESSGDRARFAPVPVRLLQPAGAGWLVDGLSTHEWIVVRGAGVLWSLQGLGGVEAGEGEPD